MGDKDEYPAPQAHETDAQQSVDRRTELERAQERGDYHGKEADKANRAISFLREHPEFDEFVRLIHEGAIRL